MGLFVEKLYIYISNTSIWHIGLCHGIYIYSFIGSGMTRGVKVLKTSMTTPKGYQHSTKMVVPVCGQPGKHAKLSPSPILLYLVETLPRAMIFIGSLSLSTITVSRQAAVTEAYSNDKTSF